MGLFDKFLNVMRLNPDDEDDFYDDDYYDEEEDEAPRKKLFSKSEDDFAPDNEVREKPARTSQKITPMRPSRKQISAAGMEVCVIKPKSMEDAREITETLLSGRTVILNLEGLDLEVAQRIIDFTSGATYAISGNLQKISNYIFLVTPTNVDISGDLQDLLNTSLDTSSMRTRF